VSLLADETSSRGGGAARVPDAEIGRLKAEVPLAALAEAAGVELRPAGADLTGRCPFHEDGTPSLVISPGKNLWHCMGACQAGGSVIDWVMRAEGVSFRHAVELLRDGLPAVSPAGAGPKRSTVRRLAPPVERTAADHELLGQVIGYYHKVLMESPDVHSYLARRKIDHPDVAGEFRLGFADRTLGLRDKRRKDGAQLRGRLEALGIFRASGHEHFAGSLVIPVFGEQGAASEVYGRKVRDDLREGTPRHLYLPGPHRAGDRVPGSSGNCSPARPPGCFRQLRGAARLGVMAPARRRLVFFSAAVLAVLGAVLTVLLPAGTASAATVPAAETRVWAISPAAQPRAGADSLVSPGHHLGEPSACPFYAPGSCAAAEETGVDAGVAARDVHGAVSSGRGVDVENVLQNGDLYYQDDGQLVRVLDNGNGTSDVVIRGPSNPSSAPATTIKDMPDSQVQARINSGRWWG
jgi:hypothetical protein